MRIALIILSICLVAVVALALGQYFFATEEPFPVVSLIHYYKEPSVSLNNIDLRIFYVTTPDKTPLAGWQKEFEESLKKIVHFHGVQFLGKSFVTYEIDPDPLVIDPKLLGSRPLFSEDPSVLEAIEAQTPRTAAVPGHHRILLFITEAEGLGGKPGAAYVPARIFRAESLRAVRESVIYHALGHAMGLPEGNEGVMGAGMLRPIEMTFLEPELAQRMGLLD